MSNQIEKRENIVIVGGGSIGLRTWKELSTQLDASKHNLVLITSRPFFTHLPATIRMVVAADGNLEDSVLAPLPKEKFSTGNKKLIIASVTSIVEHEGQSGHVVLDNGEKVDYSILILTPGSIWEGPVALPNTKAETVKSITAWRKRFAEAQNIVLVGGGAIADKNVTIVHGQSLLLNDTYPESWRKYVGKQYGARGIDTVLGDYVDDIEIKDGHITTRGGKRIPADLVVPARGGRLNTKFIQSLGDDVVTPSGAVKINPTFQVVGHPRIFAGGDIIEWNEQKQAAKAPNHAAILKNNVLSLLGLTKNAMTPYKGSTEIMLLTNGKNGGTGYFGILWGITIGNFLSAMLKSKKLFIDSTRSALGL